MSVTARFAAVFCLLAVPSAYAGVTIVTSDRDNTLYESASGHLSNGAGEWCFAGRTNQGFIRRCLVRFDVSAIPQGATIESATLRLTHTLGQPSAAAISLHRALAGWGEGTSDAPNNEGFGADATPGDATWLHTSFDSALWSAPGGDFVSAASATTMVGPDVGDYLWSDALMASDVAVWVSDPSANHGWLLRADESIRFGTAKRFATRENLEPTILPQLTVVWSVFGDLDDDGVVGPSDLAILLGQWGQAGSADLDQDGAVGPGDLARVLGAWTT
jgi:hypothetical protein